MDPRTQDDEEWSLGMSELLPDLGRKGDDMLTRGERRRPAANSFSWGAQQSERDGRWAHVMWMGKKSWTTNAQLRHEQHPSDGTSFPRAEWQPDTHLGVSQERHLSVFRVSFSRKVLPVAHKEYISSGYTCLMSHKFSLFIHYELSKTLAESIDLQTRRGVFLDWWQRGRTAQMEVGSDR